MKINRFTSSENAVCLEEKILEAGKKISPEHIKEAEFYIYQDIKAALLFLEENSDSTSLFYAGLNEYRDIVFKLLTTRPPRYLAVINRMEQEGIFKHEYRIEFVSAHEVAHLEELDVLDKKEELISEYNKAFFERWDLAGPAQEMLDFYLDAQANLILVQRGYAEQALLEMQDWVNLCTKWKQDDGKIWYTLFVPATCQALESFYKKEARKLKQMYFEWAKKEIFKEIIEKKVYTDHRTLAEFLLSNFIAR